MRELFISSDFEIEELELFLVIDFIVRRHRHTVGPLTRYQLYHKTAHLLADGVTPDSFFRLLNRGLLCGHVDWDLLYAEHPLPSYEGDGFYELWVAGSRGADGYFLDWAKRNHHTLVRTSSRTFEPQFLYHAVQRIHARMIRGEKTELVYLANHNSMTVGSYQKWRSRLLKMLRVRHARHLFNETMGRVIWKPAGLSLIPRGEGSRVNRIVTKSLGAADRVIERLLGVSLVTAPPGIPMAQVPVENMERLISPQTIQ